MTQLIIQLSASLSSPFRQNGQENRTRQEFREVARTRWEGVGRGAGFVARIARIARGGATQRAAQRIQPATDPLPISRNSYRARKSVFVEGFGGRRVITLLKLTPSATMLGGAVTPGTPDCISLKGAPRWIDAISSPPSPPPPARSRLDCPRFWPAR